MNKLANVLVGCVAASVMAVCVASPALAGDRYGYGRGHGYGHGMSRDEAVQRCVRAAERDAHRQGHGRAEVTEVTGVSRKDSGFNVKGRIVVNPGHRGWDRHGDDRGKFSCRIRYGRVADVRFSGLRLGYYR